jgi:hypothetical protein
MRTFLLLNLLKFGTPVNLALKARTLIQINSLFFTKAIAPTAAASTQAEEIYCPSNEKSINPNVYKLMIPVKCRKHEEFFKLFPHHPLLLHFAASCERNLLSVCRLMLPTKEISF